MRSYAGEPSTRWYAGEGLRARAVASASSSSSSIERSTSGAAPRRARYSTPSEESESERSVSTWGVLSPARKWTSSALSRASQRALEPACASRNEMPSRPRKAVPTDLGGRSCRCTHTSLVRSRSSNGPLPVDSPHRLQSFGKSSSGRTSPTQWSASVRAPLSMLIAQLATGTRAAGAKWIESAPVCAWHCSSPPMLA